MERKIIPTISSFMRQRALALYKQLLRYSQELIFTEKKYFQEQIRKHYFNKELTESEVRDNIKVLGFLHSIFFWDTLYFF